MYGIVVDTYVILMMVMMLIYLLHYILTLVTIY